MSEIALSCMIDPGALDLQSFEARQRVRLGVQHMDWDGAWDRLLRVDLDAGLAARVTALIDELERTLLATW